MYLIYYDLQSIAAWDDDYFSFDFASAFEAIVNDTRAQFADSHVDVSAINAAVRRSADAGISAAQAIHAHAIAELREPKETIVAGYVADVRAARKPLLCRRSYRDVVAFFARFYTELVHYSSDTCLALNLNQAVHNLRTYVQKETEILHFDIGNLAEVPDSLAVAGFVNSAAAQLGAAIDGTVAVGWPRQLDYYKICLAGIEQTVREARDVTVKVITECLE